MSLNSGNSQPPTLGIVRINYLTEFHYGDDAVLLTMDRTGVHDLRAMLRDAAQNGSSRLEHAGVIHEFNIEPGAADIELHPTYVTWRIDPTLAATIIEQLTSLMQGAHHRPCHQYVDNMHTPTDLLILSRDEYVDPTYPWTQPPEANRQ